MKTLLLQQDVHSFAWLLLRNILEILGSCSFCTDKLIAEYAFQSTYYSPLSMQLTMVNKLYTFS